MRSSSIHGWKGNKVDADNGLVHTNITSVTSKSRLADIGTDTIISKIHQSETFRLKVISDL